MPAVTAPVCCWWAAACHTGIPTAAPHGASPRIFLPAPPVRSRPGILVLINDCDWELEGQLDAPVTDGDAVVFISTLHGG